MPPFSRSPQGASVALVEHDYHTHPRPSSSSSSPPASSGQLFLFGGRLVSSRQMINDLYILDLDTREWRKVPFDKDFDDDGNRIKPLPRYFHSCELWDDKLLFFGGMGVVADRSQPTSPATSSPSDKSDGLSVLDEILVLNLRTFKWEFDFVIDQDTSNASPSTPRPCPRPHPRYAHLSSLTGDKMVIIGGQNMANKYVEEINVLDLKKRTWVITHNFPRQCGSYRSLAVSPPFVIDGQKTTPELADAIAGRPRALSKASSITTASSLVYPNTPANDSSSSQLPGGPNEGESHQATSPLARLHPLPTSRPPRSDEETPPIYIYSNYNFTDVKRELEVAKVSPSIPQSDTSDEQQTEGITLEDRSGEMAGATLPPGLRFPTGMMAGENLLVAGTYLANTSQSFSVWTLSLSQMTWTRLDAGPLLGKGSWNRAMMWPKQNRLIILGNRQRDLVTDYNHRQTNWDQLLLLDLEAWGISQPPRRLMTDQGLEMGLKKLETAMRSSSIYSSPSLSSAARGSKSTAMHGGQPFLDSQSWLREHQPGSVSGATGLPTLPTAFGAAGDFEVVCSDGIRIGCDRMILEARWPWFRDRLANFKQQARSAAEVVRARNPSSMTDSSWSAFPYGSSRNGIHRTNGDGSSTPAPGSASRTPTTPSFSFTNTTSNPNGDDASHASHHHRLADCRFLPRELHIPEPSPVVLALIQFFYTQCICTPLQRHPAIVASLLILSRAYKMEDTLGAWARHAASVLLGGDLLPDSLRAAPSSSPANATPTSGSEASAAAVGSGALTKSADSAPASSIPLEECHRLAVVIYEAAGLAEYEPLQLRALRAVVFLSKALQQRAGGTGTSSTTPRPQQQPPSPGHLMSPTTSLTSISSFSQSQQPRRPSEPIRVATSSSVPLASKEAMTSSPMRPPSPARAARPTSAIAQPTSAMTDTQTAKLERLFGFSGGRANTSSMKSGGEMRSQESASSPIVPPSEESPNVGGGASVASSGFGPDPGFGERRPSAPAGYTPQYHSSSSSYTSSGPPRPARGGASPGSSTNRQTSSGSTGRKRFSLFGRSNNDAAAAATSGAQAEDGADKNGRWGSHNNGASGGPPPHHFSDSIDPKDTIEEETSRLSMGTGSSESTISGSATATAATKGSNSSGSGGAASVFTAPNPAATSLANWSPNPDGLSAGPAGLPGSGGGSSGRKGSAIGASPATDSTPPAFFLF